MLERIFKYTDIKNGYLETRMEQYTRKKDFKLDIGVANHPNWPGTGEEFSLIPVIQ